MMIVSSITNTESWYWPFRRCYCIAISVERASFFFSIDYLRFYLSILFSSQKTCALALCQIKASVLDDEENHGIAGDV